MLICMRFEVEPVQVFSQILQIAKRPRSECMQLLLFWICENNSNLFDNELDTKSYNLQRTGIFSLYAWPRPYEGPNSNSIYYSNPL